MCEQRKENPVRLKQHTILQVHAHLHTLVRHRHKRILFDLAVGLYLFNEAQVLPFCDILYIQKELSIIQPVVSSAETWDFIQ